MVKHTVKCKKFPDPFDERDPVGPCTCGAEERTTDPCVHQYEYVSLGGQMQHWVCNKCGAIGYGSPGNIEASGRYIQKRTYADTAGTYAETADARTSNPPGSDASLRSELDRLAKEHGGYVSDIMEWASLRNKGMADEIERQARLLAFNDMELRRLGGEIASLTAELATMREAHGTYVELYPKVCIERDRLALENQELKTSNEKFRAALELIAYQPICDRQAEAREALAGRLSEE